MAFEAPRGAGWPREEGAGDRAGGSERGRALPGA